jgi:hypothetical protein
VLQIVCEDHPQALIFISELFEMTFFVISKFLTYIAISQCLVGTFSILKIHPGLLNF